MEPGNPFKDDFIPPPVAYDPSLLPSDVNPPPLRLSILHLIFLTTGVALAIAITDKNVGSMPASYAAKTYVMQLISAFVNGIAISAIAIAVEQRFRPVPGFPRQPGHWLFLEFGFGACISILYRTVYQWTVLADETNVVVSVFANLVIFGAHIVCLVIGVRQTERGAWRNLLIYGVLHYLLLAVFAIVAMILITSDSPWMWGGFFTAYEFVAGASYLIYAGWAFVLAIADRRRPRDVLHYVGVGVIVAEFLVTLLWRVVYRF